MTAPLLLTWNPGPDDDRVYDGARWSAEVVAPCAAGEVVASTWGVGRHRHGIGPDQPAVLHRQGVHGRGIVARGVITSGVLTGERDRTPGRVTNYVELQWHEAVPVDLRLDLDDLQPLTPDFAWRHVYSSGRRLPPSTAEVVVAEWQAHLREPVVADALRALADGRRPG